MHAARRTAGNDILYDDKLCRAGPQLLQQDMERVPPRQRLGSGRYRTARSSPEAVKWFGDNLDATIAEIEDLFGKFRLSEALMAVYRLFWDEFSSWYLEMVKPAYGRPSTAPPTRPHSDTSTPCCVCFTRFMPIHHRRAVAAHSRTPPRRVDHVRVHATGRRDRRRTLAMMEHAKEVVIGVRGVRAAKNIPPKQQLELNIFDDMTAGEKSVVAKLANLSAINLAAVKDPTAAKFMVGATEYEVPMASNIDVEAELEKLRKDLDYQKGFLASVMKKLSNERFVNNAPAAVVDAERRKQADSEAKIATLEASIAALSK